MTQPLLIRSLMLVVDGTDSGVAAARYAVRSAAQHQAALTAVAVVDTATLKTLLKSSVLVEAEMQEFDQELEVSARANLNYVAQLASEQGITVEPVLKKGSAHSIVIDEARRLKPDLLVMGSFSTSMIKHDLSARERRLIVDEVKCPILLVPHRPET
jgi:nucleotide-binding universal stress UspA family protein